MASYYEKAYITVETRVKIEWKRGSPKARRLAEKAAKDGYFEASGVDVDAGGYSAKVVSSKIKKAGT